MTDQGNKTVIRAGQVLEALFARDFQPKTTLEIAHETDLAQSTVYRIIRSWEALGWVVAVPESGTRLTRYMVSERLVEIASSYKRYALGRVQAVRAEHKRLTGEELNG